FLHAYANPAHEQRMRDILAAEHPAAVVSLSSEVLREYREYERAMTTLIDAAVKPRVSRYVATIRRRLSGYAGPVPFLIMKSNGGVVSAEEVVHQPITTVLSGPAAGALGAALVAQTAGFDKVLTLDGGGTSTDVSVVLHGQPTLTTEGSVGGYPSKIPMIDIVTVGAGGGSVASLTRDGTLRVGPGQRAAAGHRQARPGRARLRAHHVRRLRFAAGVPAGRHPRPARRAGTARSRQPVRVRAVDRRREERLRADVRGAARIGG